LGYIEKVLVVFQRERRRWGASERQASRRRSSLVSLWELPSWLYQISCQIPADKKRWQSGRPQL